MSLKKALAIAAFLGVLGAGAWGWKAKAAKPKGKGFNRPVAVTESSVEEKVESTGSVAPFHRIEIKPPISGRIEKLLVEEGATV